MGLAGDVGGSYCVSGAAGRLGDCDSPVAVLYWTRGGCNASGGGWRSAELCVVESRARKGRRKVGGRDDVCHCTSEAACLIQRESIVLLDFFSPLKWLTAECWSSSATDFTLVPFTPRG